MPVIKNILRKSVNSYQGLKDFNVLIEDTAPNSQYFNIFDLPEELSLGCSSFLIEGSNLLKHGVELKIELLDSENNVVFTTPVDNYLEDKSRRVSIEVYGNVAPGVATLTILGELDPTKTNVPQSFRDVYNVRFTKRVNINKTKENDRPIRFYGQPTISVSEIVKGVIEETTGGTNQTSTVTGTIALNVTTNKVIDTEVNVALPTNNVDDIGEDDYIKSESPKSKKTATFNSKIAKKSKKKKKQKKFKTTHTITGNVVTMGAGTNNSTNKITSDFVGATITISNPHQLVDTDKFPTTRYSLPTSYSTTISEVVNETTFKVKTPYYITNDTQQRIPVSLESATNNASITYDSYVEETESSIFKRSYADITVGNLRTFSGDVYKAKILTRDSNTPTDFEKIYDAYVEPPNILIDQTSATGFTNIGFFHQQTDINNNWVSSSIGGSTGALATQNNQYLVDGLLLSGSNKPIDSLVEFRTTNSFDLVNDVDYVVRFDSYFFKELGEYKSDQDTISTNKRADLRVYLSGSGLTGNEGEEDYYLGQVEIPENSNDEGEISSVIGSFRTAASGSPKAWLKFKLNSGQFIIKDVSIEPFSEENFNPNYFRTIVPMPGLVNVKRDRLFDFRAEFYDVNNNEADVGATIERINFDGVPTIIQGTDGNKLSGSLLIGESIEMYGTNPAYMRSVGYQGFAHTIANNKGGFLLFSGSIGDGAAGGNRLTASEAYQGVGLEIVDAHASTDRFLKFRTNPSEFTVQTDQFFFGKDGQFISGSNGNIVISSSNFFLGGESTFVSGSNDKLEISSSNFHLDNDGSVIMAGTITAAAGGTIGGFDIGSSTLSVGTGANFIALDSTNKKLRIGAKASLTDSNTGVHVSTDGIALGASSVFKVTNAGAVTAGNITATGGKIANFTIDGHSLTTTGVEINDSTQGLFISSSIFKVDHSGNVTASNVDLSGKITATSGEIGGFTIDGHSLTSTGIEINDATQTLFISSSNFKVKHTGEISGSDVLFTGGKIGGWTIASSTLTGGNVQLSSAGTIKVGSVTDATTTATTNAGFFADNSGNVLIKGNVNGDDYIKVTGGGGIDIKANDFDLNAGSGKLIIESSTPSISLTDATAKFIVGNLDSVTDTSDGDKGIYAQGDGKLLIKEDASNYIQFNGGLDIKTETFKLDTDRLDIDSSTSRISVFDDTGSPKEVIRIGEVDGASNFGMKIFDGTGTADSDILVEFSETENTIAGWDISTSTISKNNIVIDSSGFISSQGYASNVQGFFLGARALSDGSIGSFLEVDEANIRGTLKTTVFEKESVNAVGGQLHIANATTITGSVSMSATATTMSVANASGFAAGEVILAKKFNATGFSTEYMLVNSASREDITSDVNFSGSLMVTRALGQSAPQGTVSSSIGFSGSVGQEYTPGQVIVSTGKIGTGYIRLNANPNDQTTPYMDIVERTGSGVYDINLKARLGDLSGVVDTINGQSVSGFGLYTDNAFLKGGIVASYGSIGGFNMSSTDLWAGNATLGNAGTVMVLGDTNTSTPKIALGGQANNITATSGTGIYMDGSSTSKFRVGNPSGQFIYWNGSALSIAGSITISNPGDIDISDLTNDSGFTDDTTANAATGSAATAQLTANAATGSAAAAQATANAATGSAATAQSAIDLMETRVVIDNTGMALKAKTDGGSATLNGQTIAEYGTTTTFFDGVASADANKKLELNASGITLFGSQAGNDFLKLEAGGIEMRSNNVRTLHITDNGINIGPSATGPSSANTPSAVAGNISLHGQGARIYGEATNDYVDVKANGVDVVAAGTNVAAFGATTRIGDIANEHISASSVGVTIKDGPKILANYSSTSKIFDGENNNSFVEVGNGGIIFVSGSVTGSEFGHANGQFTASFFGAADKEERVEITEDGMEIYQGDTTKAIFGTNTTLTGGTLTIQGTAGTIGDDKIVVGGGSLAMFANASKLIDIVDGKINIGPAAVGGTAVTGNVRVEAGNVYIYGNATNTFTQMSSAGLSVFKGDASNPVAVFGTDATVGLDEAGKSNVFVDSDGNVDIRRGTEVSASFGTTTTIGPTTGQHVSIDSDSLDIKAGSTVLSTFGTDAIIGEVGSGKRNVKIDADAGILIRTNETDLANFDTDITLGEVGTNKRNVFIDASAGVKIRNNTTDIASFGSDVTLTGGTFTINDGTRNRLVIGSTSIAMTDEAGNEQVKIEDASGTPTLTLGEVAANQENIVIDPTNGVRLRTNTTTHAQLAGTEFVMGEVASSKSNVQITAGTVNFRNNTDVLFAITDDGQISGSDFMIEKTRLFGNGNDGIITLEHDNCAVSDGVGSAAKSSTSLIVNERGENLCERTGTTWFLKGDMYAKDLTLNNDGTAVTLNTSGSRLFVKSTLTIDSSCIIHNDGNAGGNGGNGGNDGDVAGTRGSAGHGGAGNSLAPGTTGAQGGLGGTSSSTPNGRPGGGGGGAGGTGGHVFIAARVINNSGTIRSHGGAGGNGGTGGSV